MIPSKKQVFITLLLIILSANSFAQQELENDSLSFVVISEDDLTSLIKTLRKHKNNKALKNSIYNSKIASDSTKIESVSDSKLINPLNDSNDLYRLNTSDTNTAANTLNNKNLKALEKEISQLKSAIKQLSSTNKNVANTTLPQKDITRIVEVPQTIYIKEDKKLQSQLDSLYKVYKSIEQPKNINYSEDFLTIQKKIDSLKKDIQLKNDTPSNYAELSKKYKGYNKIIYFEDNSKTLNKNSSLIIDELNAVINANENLDVIIKGFASNKGNAIYNENLSMQRTEAVKKALMLSGIHPTRVLTQYHGIDYEAKNEFEARRVEISILVRK